MVIEWAMIGAAGALVASLLWLIALPVVARRSTRRAMERLSQQMPMTMSAIAADKDRLRAGHAEAVRRLEQTAEANQARLSALMSESGRQVTRIVALEAEAAAAHRTVAELTDALATTTRAMHEAEATLGTQVVLLHDALGLAERRGELLHATEARLGAIDTENQERRTIIAGLETRATGEDLRLRAALAAIGRLTADLAAARSTLDDLGETLQIARADGALAAKERAALASRVEQMVAALASLEADRETAATALARSEQRLRIQAATIEGLGERVSAQDAEHDALHRLFEEASTRRDALQAERNRLVAERDTAMAEAATSAAEPSEDRAARLRAAVAALAADLVAFAAADGPDRAVEPVTAPDGVA